MEMENTNGHSIENIETIFFIRNERNYIEAIWFRPKSDVITDESRAIKLIKNMIIYLINNKN